MNNANSMLAPTKEEMVFTKKMIDLMAQSPTSFHVVETNKKVLLENGFEELNESERWNLAPGGKYFVTKNLSCMVAFILPEANNLKELRDKLNGFMINASHSDHPCFKIKRNPEIDVEGHYTVLNTEPYGGTLYYSWMDRPLTVAGRVFLQTEKGFTTKPVYVDRSLFIIPSLSIHQSDNVNTKGFVANAHTQLRPLYGSAGSQTLIELVARENNIDRKDIIDYELFAVRSAKPSIWGANREFISARGIDDQACVFSSLIALTEAKPIYSIPVHMVFDNEEIGSCTKQGADSSVAINILSKVLACLGVNADQYYQTFPSSFMISADNGHALHPNYPDANDDKVKSYLGNGPVLKYAAGFSYSTDGLSSSVAYKIAHKCGVHLQEYYNKSGIVPGSTLAKFLSPSINIMSIDLGLPQLAMHSSYETCSSKDPVHLKNFIKACFSSSIKMEKDGTYTVI